MKVVGWVYDDSAEVPPAVASWLGLERFGRLLVRRQRLEERTLAAGRRAGLPRPKVLRSEADRRALVDTLLGTSGRWLVVSSEVSAADADTLALWLEKMALLGQDGWARPPAGTAAGGIGNLEVAGLRAWLSAPVEGRPAQVAAAPALTSADLVDLRDPDAATRFLASAFAARHFNRLSIGDRVIEKSSTDRDKIEREHQWYYLLPPAQQRWVVQPFDLRVGPERASYRMERLRVPDLSVLWVHGEEALPLAAFEALLDALTAWIEERPTRAVPEAEARARAEALYRTKVRRRLSELAATPQGAQLEGLLAAAGLGGWETLRQRYEALLDAAWRRAPPRGPLALLHGDLCFSNLLFDKRTGLLRLIDPKGARTEAELYDDPWYDLAKLSHSVLGGYDFVHHALFDVTLTDSLGFELVLDRPPPGAREARFVQRLTQMGYEPARLRLYEASLFLSMIPLHADAPRKQLAFALIAAQLLTTLESS